MIWRQRCHHDQINVIGPDPSNGECARRRDGCHRGGCLTLRRNAALTNSGARGNPFVARLHDLLKIGIRQDRGRHLMPPAGDMRGAVRQLRASGRPTNALLVHVATTHGSSSMIGDFDFTRRPFSATMRSTRPALSDLISLKSFIASIRPIG